VFLVLALGFGASSCQAVARVTVAERAAGDGTVSVSLALDKAAAAQFADLGPRLRLDDLRKAGWAVTGPATAPDGSATVTVSRAFRDAAGARALLAQVSGPSGPLSGLRVEHHHSPFTTRSGIQGNVDLRLGADAFADPRLSQQLGVPSLSKALSTLHQAGGADPGLRLELAARLPGRSKVWSVPLGQTLAVSASSRQLNKVNVGLAVVAGLCLLGLAAAGLHRLGFGGQRRRDSWTIATPRRR
jgi:hypothetical protein